MASIADLKDFRGEGPPADIGTFIFPASAVGFSFTFSGVTFYAVIRVGVSGWVLVGAPATIPETPINAAFTALGAGARIVLLDGTYTLTDTASIAFTANQQVLEGQGRGTFIDLPDYTPTTNHAIVLSGFDDCMIRNLSVQTVAGGGDTIHCIFIEDGADRFLIENVWIVESDANGIHIEGTTINGGIISKCHVLGADENGILVDLLAGSFMYRLLITENSITGAGDQGILIAASAGNNYCLIKGNIVFGITQEGIYVINYDYSSIENNIVYECRQGIQVHNSTYASITDNTSYNNLRHGINLLNSDDCTIEDNQCIANDSGNTGSFDGINIDGASDDNLLLGNKCNDNDRYGINVAGANNWVIKNGLSGNTAGPFNDTGTNTKLATIPIQFVQGSVFISQDAFAKGWHIQQANEYAVALGQLPLEVQQVVRIKIWAVALDAPLGGGGQMHLEIIFNAGASNAAFNTVAKSWTLTDFDSEEADYIADDVVHWVIEDGDVGDELSNLVAADSAELKVIYEAGAAPDGDTDAVFRVVEVEYV